MAERLQARLGENARGAVDVESSDPLRRVQALRLAESHLDVWLVEAVADARREGRSWEESGQALGVSRQAAWELFRARARHLLGATRRESGLTEEEALALAVEETRAVRRHRRRA